MKLTSMMCPNGEGHQTILILESLKMQKLFNFKQVIDSLLRRFDNANQSEPTRQDILHEWVGPWVSAPKTPKDRAASVLALEATKFTKSNSLISPVAVAAIDILGMNALLREKSLIEIAESFAEPFYDLNGPAYTLNQSLFTGEDLEKSGYRRMASIYSTVISDTIFLARRPDWEHGNAAIAEADAVVWLAEYVCKIIKINYLQGIRLRAAISFGECIISIKGRSALLGAATGEAAAWEKQQEWIGGMLTPSAVGVLKNGAIAAKQVNGTSFEVRYPNFLFQHSIPLKPDCVALSEPQIALNWFTGLIPGTLFWSMEAPNAEPESAPISVRQKVANTIEFITHCPDITARTTINWGS